MYGAISGDMIGCPYEFDSGDKTKDFPLFISDSNFTDDSVMTVAVAEALMDTLGQDDEAVKAALVNSMQKWGHKYPDAGYGGMFYRWLLTKDPKPYGSYGNGSAMRVSAAGWLYNTLEKTRHMAKLTAEVTHNHPEGIKGAEATAAAIYMSRTGRSKEEIKSYIIRTAFMEGTDFEDVIRTAVSLGGDCDTLTCIAGGMAEAFYGIPDFIKAECRRRLPADMLMICDRFESVVNGKDKS